MIYLNTLTGSFRHLIYSFLLPTNFLRKTLFMVVRPTLDSFFSCHFLQFYISIVFLNKELLINLNKSFSKYFRYLFSVLSTCLCVVSSKNMSMLDSNHASWLNSITLCTFLESIRIHSQVPASKLLCVWHTFSSHADYT